MLWISFSVAYSFLQTALQRAGVTDAAALLATLLAIRDGIDTPAILRPANGATVFMPLGMRYFPHRAKRQWRPFAGLHAAFGDLLSAAQQQRDERYIQQAIDHALPSGSPTFDIFNVPLQNPV